MKICGNQTFYKDKILGQNEQNRMMPKIDAEEWKNQKVACNASA
jgi:hypothetical protein